MNPNLKPDAKPSNPNFSSGPCSKRPGYNLANLDIATLGRSHRSKLGKAVLQSVCERTHDILDLPAGYKVGVVPASDTGAMEMAMWSLLGSKPVDVFGWESFGQEWVADITEQLKLDNVNSYIAGYGDIPDMSQANPEHDLVFTWNGTTSGAKLPNADFIDDARQGLTICDATSAVFAMHMPWSKLDVVTFSWQKALGGEGAHGMIILSPKAINRLESYTPPWPMPKIFRLTSGGKLSSGIFEGATINTPSMLCVADYLDALDWVESLGGVEKAIEKSLDNLAVLDDFVSQKPWIHFLAKDADIRSNTSVCFTVDLSEQQIKQMIKLLDDEQVAYDIGSYRDAPAGLRIWAGATIERADLEALLPWLEWAYYEVKKEG